MPEKTLTFKKNHSKNEKIAEVEKITKIIRMLIENIEIGTLTFRTKIKHKKS